MLKLEQDETYDYYAKTIANYFAVPKEIVDFRIDAIAYYADEKDRRQRAKEKAKAVKKTARK